MTPFSDRIEAGRRLALELVKLRGRNDVTVLALPRGGVPVACEVARELRAPVDVLPVRKLGLPGHEEFAMGAIAGGGVKVLDHALIRSVGLPAAVVDEVVRREEAELRRREAAYRDHRVRAPIAGRTVVLVDDGLATGATMHAAVMALSQLAPRAVIVAAPVASEEAVRRLEAVASAVVVIARPEPFLGVGAWYSEFPQLTDEEVRRSLADAAAATE